MSFNLQLLAARKKITLNLNKKKCIEIFRLRLGYKQSRSKCNLPVLQVTAPFQPVIINWNMLENLKQIQLIENQRK